MSANSSSNSSLVCVFKTSISIFMAVFAMYLLLLPLFLLVLYVGYQRWRKSLTSHSDVFTFHMVVLELIALSGFCFYSYSIYSGDSVFMVGASLVSIASFAQMFLHILTCVERYLAVVHPVTYLGLRQGGGVQIRNICIGCVWLISFGSASLQWFDSNNLLYFILLALSSVAMSFCSVCVLCGLIRPGPGEVGGKKGRVDQSKQRAFYTIMAIMGALLVKFLSSLVSNSLYISSAISICDHFVMMWSTAWFSVPSSLVLPLLFLHRAGKLPGCTHNTESA